MTLTPQRVDLVPRPVRHHRLDQPPTAPPTRWRATSPSRRRPPPSWPGCWACPTPPPCQTLPRPCPTPAALPLCPPSPALGAPHWDDAATGTITGMTHGTTPAHLARATFEAIAHQIADVFDGDGAGHRPAPARPQCRWRRLVQSLPDATAGRPAGPPRPVPAVEEVGALGAAAMAFAALGTPMPPGTTPPVRYEPRTGPCRPRPAVLQQWSAAVAKARHR